MPVKSRIEGGVLRITAIADYAWRDILATLERARGEERFVAGETVLLVDLSHTTSTRSADELRDIAADLGGMAREFGAILFVATDDLRYGLARMLAAYAEHLGFEILVFRSMDAADSWVRANPAGRSLRPPAPPLRGPGSAGAGPDGPGGDAAGPPSRG